MMNGGQPSVKAYVEPQLFPDGGIAVTLQALIDRADQTVIFVCEARDVTAGKLLALWSTSPVGLEDAEKHSRRALQEYRDQLHEFTGPF